MLGARTSRPHFIRAFWEGFYLFAGKADVPSVSCKFLYIDKPSRSALNADAMSAARQQNPPMTSIKQRLRNELRDAGWHSRGYLPHFNGDEIPQTVTFRLADSLPLRVIKRWKEELRKNSMESLHSILRKRIECYLDQGCGSCALRNTSVAGMLQDSLLHFDGARYQLSAWVVMPNHVHMLLTPNTAWSLSQIMKDVKSFTSHEANRILRQQGQFWMEDYFDRYVRDKKHFVNAIAYIENNPVKARLCRKSEDWPFSSAWFRAQES